LFKNDKIVAVRNKTNELFRFLNLELEFYI